MEQTNLNDLFSIPNCVVKAPRAPSSNQGFGFKGTSPHDSGLELVTQQDLWRQSTLSDAPTINRSDAWHSPDLDVSHVDYARMDPWEPEWLRRFQDLPPIYGQVLMATTRSYGLDTDTIYQVFLSSGLDPRVLQHIWSLVNRSHPGWLTPSELVMALALIAFAQRDQVHLHQPTESIISNLSVQKVYRCSAPPVPNVALPCPVGTLFHGNLTEPFRAMDPNVVVQLSDPTVLNGFCDLGTSSVAGSLPPTSSTAPQMSDDDWADFTSCKTSNYALPSWGPPSDTVSHFEPLSESNPVDPERSLIDSYGDDFGEFQAGESAEGSVLLPVRPSLGSLALKDPALQPTVSALPNYNLSADLESYESPTDVVKNEWMRCLEQCSEVLVQSLDTLTSLTSEADREEFTGTAEARDFFLDLLEVRLIVRRIESSAMSYGLLTPELQLQFTALQSNFRKHLDYLASSDLRMSWESRDSISTSNTSSSRGTTVFSRCSVCLVAFESDEAASSDRVVALAGRQYHLPCANFWINRVQLSLPALVPP